MQHRVLAPPLGGLGAGKHTQTARYGSNGTIKKATQRNGQNRERDPTIILTKKELHSGVHKRQENHPPEKRAQPHTKEELTKGAPAAQRNRKECRKTAHTSENHAMGGIGEQASKKPEHTRTTALHGAGTTQDQRRRTTQPKRPK